jgi:hypothetical protein
MYDKLGESLVFFFNIGCASVATNVGLILYFVPKSRPVIGILGLLIGGGLIANKS